MDKPTKSLKDLVKALGIKGARTIGEDDLALDAEAFARHATAIFASRPLRVLRLWKATGADLEQALARPELGKVEELFLFRNRLSADDLAAVLSSPNLGAVRALDFKWCGFSAKHAAVLAAADPSRLPALRRLSVFGNRIGPAGVKALAGAPLLAQLTELDLDANHGGDEAAAALLGSPGMANLETLVLDRNEAGKLALAALLANPKAARLVSLGGVPGAKALLARNAAAKRPYVPVKSRPASPAAAPVVRASPSAGDAARGKALRERVVANPSDAEARAVWTDWLLEQKDPRGEHLALEAAFAAAPTPALAAKLKRARATTLKGLQQQYKNKAARFVFDRGLVTGVTCTLSWLVERGNELLTQEPVRRLELEVASVDGLTRLASVPGVDRVERLVLGKPSPKALEAVPLAALPRLSLGLKALGFPRYEPLSAYLDLPSFSRVKELSFHTVGSPAALAALAEDPRLTQLDWLELDRKLGTAEVVQALSRARWPLKYLWVPTLEPAQRRALERRFPGVVLETDDEAEEV